MKRYALLSSNYDGTKLEVGITSEEDYASSQFCGIPRERNLGGIFFTDPRTPEEIRDDFASVYLGGNRDEKKPQTKEKVYSVIYPACQKGVVQQAFVQYFGSRTANDAEKGR